MEAMSYQTALVEVITPDPDFVLLEVGSWCRYAHHYQEPEYDIRFWGCEKPEGHICTELRCRLDGKARYYGR